MIICSNDARNEKDRWLRTDACFYEIPASIAAFLPDPLTLLAIFWLHMITIALIAHGDGTTLRAMGPL
jgi:hypothetical protein